jgi:hypothetical protein
MLKYLFMITIVLTVITAAFSTSWIPLLLGGIAAFIISRRESYMREIETKGRRYRENS